MEKKQRDHREGRQRKALREGRIEEGEEKNLRKKTYSLKGSRSSKCLLGHDEVKIIRRDGFTVTCGSLQHVFKLFDTHSLS